MKHANISIFIPHTGCPHMCSFCNQHTISGTQKAPTAEEVHEICRKALKEVKSPENTEIAFFGGSFTAISESYMTELLETAHEFIGEGKFYGIRISTRPDCISKEILDILRKYGVTAIELGAQSMSDYVLEANERGHTSEDVFRASKLIREYGFELGLQIMVGLYKSDIKTEHETMKKIIEIHPDTVRIYPVVILKNTKLGELYQSGEYKTSEFDDVVKLSAMMLMCFAREGIEVIKCGLHASEFVEKDMIGGFYHPAFRELCENYIYEMEIFNIIKRDMEESAGIDKNCLIDILEYSRLMKNCRKRDLYVIAVNPSCISKAVGQKKSNIEYFRNRNIDIKIIGDKNIPKYQIELRR